MRPAVLPRRPWEREGQHLCFFLSRHARRAPMIPASAALAVTLIAKPGSEPVGRELGDPRGNWRIGPEGHPLAPRRCKCEQRPRRHVDNRREVLLVWPRAAIELPTPKVSAGTPARPSHSLSARPRTWHGSTRVVQPSDPAHKEERWHEHHREGRERVGECLARSHRAGSGIVPQAIQRGALGDAGRSLVWGLACWRPRKASPSSKAPCRNMSRLKRRRRPTRSTRLPPTRPPRLPGRSVAARLRRPRVTAARLASAIAGGGPPLALQPPNIAGLRRCVTYPVRKRGPLSPLPRSMPRTAT